MNTLGDEERFLDLQAELLDSLAKMLAGSLSSRPDVADALIETVESQFGALRNENGTPPAADSGLSALIGVGSDTVPTLGETELVEHVEPYDEQVASERITGIGDLYYLYQHERIGVFRVVQKLKELFDAGSVRLSSGEGALGLYRFDRRQVLRYTQRDRQAAYLRAFGYGRGPLVPGAQANTEFHSLFVSLNEQVARFWRDRRISDVIRERAEDPSFGSIAIIRRAGLDLRNNLKFTSYGNVAMMRVEVLQLLGESFKILGAPDVKALFGADGPWDVVEEVLTRYFNVVPVTSPRQRMAVTGREVLRWLGQHFILEESRSQFELKLKGIADDAEEWLTSAQSIGVATQSRRQRVGTAPRGLASGAAMQRPVQSRRGPDRLPV